MELIDKRALMYQLYKQSQIDSKPRAIRRARRIVEECPTVDAIPVSLIQSEIDFLRLAAEGELETNGCRGETSAELFALKHLLSVWKNEKRKQNDS